MTPDNDPDQTPVETGYYPDPADGPQGDLDQAPEPRFSEAQLSGVDDEEDA